MPALNEGSSRRSTSVFFEEFSKLAEQLQIIQPEFMTTYKE